jgi:hypothetical protein
MWGQMFERLVPTVLWSDREFVDRAMTRLPQVTYQRLRTKGFAPKTIIDVGAYHGEWAAMASKVCPTVDSHKNARNLRII